MELWSGDFTLVFRQCPNFWIFCECNSGYVPEFLKSIDHFTNLRNSFTSFFRFRNHGVLKIE